MPFSLPPDTAAPADAAPAPVAEDFPPRTRAFLEQLPLSRGLLRRLPDGGVAGDWFGCELSSVFQPIVDGASRRVVGHEAYLRMLGKGRRDLSPWTLFSANMDDERLVALDRLARTVHTLNFVGAVEEGLLFLNVHGRLLAAVSDDHGAAFRQVVDALGVAPGRIVIETPLSASAQPELLAFVLRNYRYNGFQVAVNVASPAQWQTLAAAVPANFIKIDASCLQSTHDGHERLLQLWSRRGRARVVVTRIEQPLPWPVPEDVLLQGHAYGWPEARAARLALEPLCGATVPG